MPYIDRGFLVLYDSRESLARVILDILENKYNVKLNSVHREVCLTDIVYHISFFSNAIFLNSPPILISYIEWLKVLFDKIGVPIKQVVMVFELLEVEAKKLIPEEKHERLENFINIALEELGKPVRREPESFLKEDSPFYHEAKLYLSNLLDGKREEAIRVIYGICERGVSLRDIYLKVFEPVLKEVGRLWQMRQITVVHEHYATAVTQFVMSLLYEKFLTSYERKGTRPVFVGSTTKGEKHSIGLRMVTDLLDLEGFNTYYIGSEIHEDDFIRFVEEVNPQIIGIGVTLGFNLKNLVSLLEKLRVYRSSRGIKIICGGYPFITAEDLGRMLDIDGYATNAGQAVELARNLIYE
ncbi:MAG: cobalamin-dependent protein [candidate division WOR-3 bacterium]